MSYIHHASDYRQYSHVVNTAQHRRLGLFRDSSVWRPWGFEINLGWSLMILRKPTICRPQLHVKETNVSIPQFLRIWNIFLNAGLRMDGLLALHLCDMVIEVLRSTKNTARQGRLAQGDLRGTADHSISKNKNRTPTEKWKREVDQLSNVVYVHTNNHSSKASLLYIFWRQSGCHQDDYEWNESNTETRVQNPHSCAWLVVRQNKLGPKDPNQICWHQKSTCWHANQREFHAWRVQPSSFAQHNEFLVVLFQQSQQFSFCSDRKAERHVKERPRTDFPVRWRNENQFFQRRRDLSTWCYAARGARGTILRRIWDIPSIQWMSTKDKK